MSDDNIRHRILEATADIIVKQGFAIERALSEIARKAGVSRPTVYKHAGTVDDIRQALVQRELEVFLKQLQQRLLRPDVNTEELIDALAFTVHYGRSHPILRAAVRTSPELALTSFTTDAEVAVSLVERTLRDALRPIAARLEIEDAEISLAVDIFSRLAIALVLTNTSVDLDSEDTIRDYLDRSLRLLLRLTDLH